MTFFTRRPSNTLAINSCNFLNSYSLCVIFLALVSLWPIWMIHYLPMQDYPQHLFLSHILSTYDNPSLNWKMFYRVELGLKPYMFWYLAIKPLATLVPTETAGRILISLYIILLTVLAFKLKGLSPKGTHPWAALLLFPFAFNQIYFLGFANYLLSLPLLFFAFIQLTSISKFSGQHLLLLSHYSLILIIFLIHPYTVLVYIVFALIFSFSNTDCRTTFRRVITPAAFMGLLFVFWYMTQHAQSTVPNAPVWHIYWLPLSNTAIFVLTMFTGMCWFIGIDWLTAILWGCILSIFLTAWLKYKKDTVIPHWSRLIFIICLIGLFILPFWFGYYSYFNLRLAPVTYFAVTLLLSHIHLSSKEGAVIATFCTLLLFISIQTQKSVSDEIDEITPLLNKMESNRLVLSLIFNGKSSFIDPCISAEIHNHDSSYYHVLVGGGANPNLFPNSMMPVQYQPGVSLPSPIDPTTFTWSSHGYMYDYFIIRNAPERFFERMSTNSDFITKSGPWVLFRNKSFKSYNP